MWGRMQRKSKMENVGKNQPWRGLECQGRLWGCHDDGCLIHMRVLYPHHRHIKTHEGILNEAIELMATEVKWIKL